MSEENKEFDIAPAEEENPITKTSSTLFTDPNQFYINEKPIKKKSLLKTVLVAISVLVVVALAAIAVKFLVPDKEQAVSSSSNSKTSFAVTEYSSDDVESFTLTTKDYTTVLYSSIEQAADNTSSVKWYVEGVDGSLTDSFNIASAVNSAVALNAVRKMDANQVDFGFEEPTARIEVKSRNNKFENYTITVGDLAPDRSGYYVKFSIKDDVYLVSMEDVEAFNKDIYAFANTTVISAFKPGDAPDEYFSEETLIKVDEITLGGTNYGKTVIKFKQNPDANTAAFMTYVMTQPYERYADNTNVNTIVATFAKGVYAETCYTYNATNEDIKKFGLVEPEIVLTMRAGNTTHTLKVTRQYDGYYAIMIDDRTAIYKVTRSYIEFSGLAITNYISPVVFSEMLKNFTDIDVNVDGKTYDFNINVVESEEEEDVYNVMAGSTPIKAENFQNYYAQLLGMTITEISVKNLDVAPSMTITLTRKNRTRVTIEFAQMTGRSYYVSVDGQARGYISATTYEKLQKYAALAYEGKDVISVTHG